MVDAGKDGASRWFYGNNGVESACARKNRRRFRGAGLMDQPLSSEIAPQTEGEVAAHVAVTKAGTGRTGHGVEQTGIGGIGRKERRTGVADILDREIQRRTP